MVCVPSPTGRGLKGEGPREPLQEFALAFVRYFPLSLGEG